MVFPSLNTCEPLVSTIRLWCNQASVVSKCQSMVMHLCNHAFMLLSAGTDAGCGALKAIKIARELSYSTHLAPVVFSARMAEEYIRESLICGRSPALSTNSF